MTIIVSLNGTLVPLDEARISPLDRGFLFGDAIYDVIKCIDGQAFMYDEHLNRINNSLNGLQFPKLDLSSLLDEVKQVLQENALNKGIALLYLQISRGAYAARSHEFPKEEIKPTSFLMGSPCPVVPRKGLKLATQPDYRWGLCKYKTANLLGNVLAKQAVVGDGCDEVVLVKDDVALECSASALAIIADGGKVLTHPPADYMLPSISIIGLQEVCKNQGLDFVERPFSVEEVKLADEVLVLSSVRDISQATILNGENVGDKDAATLAKLQDGFADLVKHKLS